MKAGILFVCTGNTCRSSMAEALARKWLQTKALEREIEVSSAGLAAWPGSPASAEAVEVMRERGIDLGNHSAQKVNQEIVAKCDLALTMTSGHKIALLQQFPQYGERIFSLAEYAAEGKDIPDPYGQAVIIYQKCAKELESLIDRALTNFLSSLVR